MKNLEIYTIEHKGVKVMIQVDYDKGTAGMFETGKDAFHQGIQPKKWVFVGRGLEYMNGWLNILEAMTEGVKSAKRNLEYNLAEKSKFKKKDIDEAKASVKALIKIAKNKKTK